MAREAGLRLTAHAGEWGGPQSVKDALDFLRVERIGHGVQSIDDKTLVKRLIDEDIVLEVCPGSNIALQVYDRWSNHPINPLRNEGVKVTVSTDDPPFFQTNLSREYEMLTDTFGWDDPLIREVNLTAARAAFCDEPTRTKIIKALEI
jgi:adenosine deaminase